MTEDNALTEFLDKIPNVIRWILFLPVSVAFAIVISMLSNLINVWYLGYSSETGLVKVGQHIACIVAFAYSIKYIVPKYKNVITITILGLLDVSYILGIALSIYLGEFWQELTLLNAINIVVATVLIFAFVSEYRGERLIEV